MESALGGGCWPEEEAEGRTPGEGRGEELSGSLPERTLDTSQPFPPLRARPLPGHVAGAPASALGVRRRAATCPRLAPEAGLPAPRQPPLARLLPRPQPPPPQR